MNICEKISFLLIFCVLTQFSASLRCQNEQGQEIDWFLVYKLPKHDSSISTNTELPTTGELNNNVMEGGGQYFYITSQTIKEGWTLSNYSVYDSSSILGVTLAPLWENKGNGTLLRVIYNDQAPGQVVSFARGHTKGLLAFNMSEGSGIWLPHSVPHFLDFSQGKYNYPSTGSVNGQTFMCASLPATAADQIGEQLLYTYPNVFNSYIPTSVVSQVPNLMAVIQSTTIKKPPYFHQVDLTTLGGVTMTSFAKSRKLHKDIYDDWIAPTLQVGLSVQSWPNGPNRLPSDCKTPYHVMNVETVSFPNSDITFSTHQDHSKWATSSNQLQPWFCLGDLNRMKSQELRGGGALCFENVDIQQAFQSIITTNEPCPATVNDSVQ